MCGCYVIVFVVGVEGSDGDVEILVLLDWVGVDGDV